MAEKPAGIDTLLLHSYEAILKNLFREERVETAKMMCAFSPAIGYKSPAIGRVGAYLQGEDIPE